MSTTADERRTAVRIAKRVIADDVMHTVSDDELRLLCATLTEVADVFQIHAPIIHAAKRLVSPTGTCSPNLGRPMRGGPETARIRRNTPARTGGA